MEYCYKNFIKYIKPYLYIFVNKNQKIKLFFALLSIFYYLYFIIYIFL